MADDPQKIQLKHQDKNQSRVKRVSRIFPKRVLSRRTKAKSGMTSNRETSVAPHSWYHDLTTTLLKA